MKRLQIFGAVSLIFLLSITCVHAANTVYLSKAALTGGAANALDYIDGSGLADGDIAFVWVNDVLYVYQLNGSSSDSEYSPFIISPDSNAGTKRWELQHCSTRPIVEVTSDATLTALELRHNPIYTNNGSGAAVNLTWPALAEGYRCGGYVEDAQYLRFTAPTGKKFRLGATESAAAGYVRANTVGAVIDFEVMTTDNITITNIGETWNYDE